MKPTKVIPQKTIGMLFDPTERTITQKQAIVYALGIGFSQDPLKKQDFKYSSQFAENFSVFQTIGNTFSSGAFMSLQKSPIFPQFNPHLRLHAQQRIQFFIPLTTQVKYVIKSQLVDAADKGKFALFNLQGRAYTQVQGKQQLVFVKNTLIAQKGLEGFGFKGKNVIAPIPSIPKRNPNHIFEQKTFESQAFLYRLSGDQNPIHIDPQIAKLQNFDRPLLHGLATYGMVAKSIVQNLFDNDCNKLKVYHARFINPVFPGETLVINVWNEGDKLIFSVNVKQRNKPCLIGYIVRREETKL